ncbi:MAG: chorismate synthase [Firmicutes bacterium]|nr:chorismate synthase [Bacillota bacterium]
MKNTFGNAITVTLFGESHGLAIGAVLDGIAPGIKIDEEYINSKLEQRKAKGKISTKRHEADAFEIVSGVFNGYTTGTPLCIVIKNEDVKSKDYDQMSRIARPGHADLTAFYKYKGFEDFRGGGHFSGRITAPLVAAGAILMKALEDKGVYIGTHIKKCHNICDRNFEMLKEDIELLSKLQFPVLDETIAKEMTQDIETAAEKGDSLGGILETAVIGVPEGVGEPWFDSVESMLSHGLFSIPAVKGVEFGAGFDIATMLGSEANDAYRYEGDKVVTTTNNNGGVNGGITNGMPILFRTAIKPTPSIFKTQETVDFIKSENTELSLKGRHDPAIVHRARAVVDAMTAITLADLLTVRFGTNYLGK